MQDKNLNRLDTIIQTVAYSELASSITATAGITNFAPQVALVKGKIVIIQSYNQLGGNTTKGVTLNLVGIRTSMMQHTYLLANALFSYAASLTPPDNNIMQLTKLHKGTLENMSKQNCVAKCDIIQQLAAANAAAIAPFGASATDITDTAALITLYYNGIDDPRGAAITRANANKQALLTLNQTISVELELKLDTMANTLRFTNSEWWDGYRFAREIVDPGAFATVFKLLVLNKANNEPLKNVKCYRDGSITFKKSSDKGFITYKDIEEGPHTFVLKHKLFEDLTVSGIMISHGKKLEVTALMKPIGGTTTIIREGDLGMGIITRINTDNINSTSASTLKIEATNGTFRVYAAANPTDLPGPIFIDVIPGSPYNNLAEAFAALIGLDDTKPNLMIQYIGVGTGHYKFTFGNLSS